MFLNALLKTFFINFYRFDFITYGTSNFDWKEKRLKTFFSIHPWFPVLIKQKFMFKK